MKRSYIAGLSAIALIATVPFVATMPGFAGLQQQFNSAIAQNAPAKKVQLRLEAEKQVVENTQGKQQVSWKALEGNVVVQPGDVLRYKLSGENNSDRPIKNLVLLQPIPKQTVFVLSSATVPSGAKITYSIDAGKTFVAQPTVQVKAANGTVETKPAPAEAYTHIRWDVNSPIAPATKLSATYQVKVR